MFAVPLIATRKATRAASRLMPSPNTPVGEVAGAAQRADCFSGWGGLLRVTVRRLDLAAEIYHLREPQKIPQILSPDETRRLLAVASSLKARVMLSLSYCCGLRVSEVVRLKVKHIDSAQ